MVHYELRDNEIGFIQIDDGKANALSPEIIAALIKTLDQAESEAKVVVIAGRQGKFSGGFDLKYMLASPESAQTILRAGVELYIRLYGFSKPVVMACTGHAIAGGAVMLLAGDYRIGAEGDFKIGLNEVAIGLPLPIFALELAKARLDPRLLSEATLLAQIYAPIHALNTGYLDRVVDADQVIEAAMVKAYELSSLQSAPFHATKKRLRQATIDHIRATVEEDLKTLLPGA